jgi:hypothetical protein
MEKFCRNHSSGSSSISSEGHFHTLYDPFHIYSITFNNLSPNDIFSLVPDPVTRHINLVEVSTESEEVENLSVIRDNRPQHKNSVTERLIGIRNSIWSLESFGWDLLFCLSHHFVEQSL